jgi:hypothetical protein
MLEPALTLNARASVENAKTLWPTLAGVEGRLIPWPAFLTLILVRESWTGCKAFNSLVDPWHSTGREIHGEDPIEWGKMESHLGVSDGRNMGRKRIWMHDVILIPKSMRNCYVTVTSICRLECFKTYIIILTFDLIEVEFGESKP